jgi:ribosomal protein S18 acetylase RimI-like enzyme
MNIRRANFDDVEAIHELGKSVSEFAVNDETVNFWPKDLLASAVQSEDVLALVAEEDQIVGFLIVNYNRSLKKALIENIYVKPEERGKGVGDALLNEMFKQLPEMGCEYVATLVPPDAQGAIDLYERSGFSQGETFIWLDKSLNERFEK